jgi:hypothetical protein
MTPRGGVALGVGRSGFSRSASATDTTRAGVTGSGGGEGTRACRWTIGRAGAGGAGETRRSKRGCGGASLAAGRAAGGGTAGGGAGASAGVSGTASGCTWGWGVGDSLNGRNSSMLRSETRGGEGATTSRSGSGEARNDGGPSTGGKGAPEPASSPTAPSPNIQRTAKSLRPESATGAGAA